MTLLDYVVYDLGLCCFIGNFCVARRICWVFVFYWFGSVTAYAGAHHTHPQRRTPSQKRQEAWPKGREGSSQGCQARQKWGALFSRTLFYPRDAGWRKVHQKCNAFTYACTLMCNSHDKAAKCKESSPVNFMMRLQPSFTNSRAFLRSHLPWSSNLLDRHILPDTVTSFLLCMMHAAIFAAHHPCYAQCTLQHLPVIEPKIDIHYPSQHFARGVFVRVYTHLFFVCVCIRLFFIRVCTRLFFIRVFSSFLCV